MKVLIAVDGSEHSYEALKWYLEYIYNPKNHLIFVNIGAPLVPTFFVGGGLAVTPDVVKNYYAAVETETKDIKAKVAEIMNKFKAEGGSYEHISQEGDAGERLCGIARDKKADMIVMGTRGLGTVRRTILGSVSDYVIHHAHCPVSICKH